MSWYHQHGTEGISTKAFMDKRFTWEDRRKASRVLRSAMVGWGVYYAAVETTYKGENAGKPRHVWAAIALVRHAPRARDGMTFGYKDMSEEMGPYESKCPRTILDLLTPTVIQSANEWRERCWAYHAKPKPKAGQHVTFAAPINFTNGDSLADFIYDKGSSFRSVDVGGSYRIRGWKDRDYTIAPA